jgi:hypothetical protein
LAQARSGKWLKQRAFLRVGMMAIDHGVFGVDSRTVVITYSA